MNLEKLIEGYLALNKNFNTLYIFPSINYKDKSTDYLYQLYKEILLKQEKIKIIPLNVLSHPKIFFKKLFNSRFILHYHWFEFQGIKSFVGILWRFFWILLYRILGGKIVWTIHNQYPHNKKYIKINRFLQCSMAKLSQRLHVHCNTAIDIISDYLKINKDKFFVYTHPDFEVKLMDKISARRSLNIDFDIPCFSDNDILFLMYGNIAKYKGIKEIIKIFNEQRLNKKLIIAGSVKKGNRKYLDEINSMIEDTNKIFIINKFFNDDETSVLFNAVDFVIFNFDEILSSGSVILALNYERKIIIPKIGCLSELKSDKIIALEKENYLNDLSEYLKSLNENK
ncbi:MAG: hypothetical protein JXA68_10075 [Ignavibacteriales bacterium]|nr:hypothetical protein [Ignavibacteriales bacterium]